MNLAIKHLALFMFPYIISLKTVYASVRIISGQQPWIVYIANGRHKPQLQTSLVSFYIPNPLVFIIVILNSGVLSQEMALMNVEMTADWKIASVARKYFNLDDRICNVKAVCCCL